MEKINLVLISRKRNWTRRLSLPWILPYFIATLFLILTTFTIALFCYRACTTAAKTNLARLEDEHLFLLAKSDSLSHLVQAANQQLETQIARDYRERTYLEMANIHPDVWSMGIGGSTSDFSDKNLSSQTQKMLDDIHDALNILCGQCNLRGKSLGEIKRKIDDNLNCYAHMPSVNPLPGRILGSPFGYRVDPFTKEIRMQWGVDIGAPTGTQIYATADGIVIFTGWNQGFGLSVEIDHGYGYVTRYAHCQSILVKLGDIIKRGQIIATVGSTGRATCSHLHYEVHVSGIRVNPSNYINLSDMIYD
jgi:murein DD-endopeptidase MepM/ murein hydrolase activator NlpD